MNTNDSNAGPSLDGAGQDRPEGSADDLDVHGSADATLGGYFRTHDRPPGFEGVDGQPYTVSIETDRTPDLRAPWEGYLVFPRWASTGLGIVGHVETPVLWRGSDRDAVLAEAGEAPLLQVQAWLNQAIVDSTAER